MHYDTVFNFYDHYLPLSNLLLLILAMVRQLPVLRYHVILFRFDRTFGCFWALFHFIIKFKRFSKEEKYLLLGNLHVSCQYLYDESPFCLFMENSSSFAIFPISWRFLSMIVFLLRYFVGFSSGDLGKQSL